MSPPLQHINTSTKPPASADVVVIGGGIIGVFSAYYLAQRGISVALVEKGRIGAEQSSVWRFARHGQLTEVRVDGDRIADDASLARQWTLAGRGITLKSALDVRQDEAAGTLMRLLPDWDTEPYPLHALLPSGRFVPARVRALVDFLADKFAAMTSS